MITIFNQEKYINVTDLWVEDQRSVTQDHSFKNQEWRLGNKSVKLIINVNKCEVFIQGKGSNGECFNINFELRFSDISLNVPDETIFISNILTIPTIISNLAICNHINSFIESSLNGFLRDKCIVCGKTRVKQYGIKNTR